MINSAPGELQNMLISWMELSNRQTIVLQRQRELKFELEKISEAVKNEILPKIENHVSLGCTKFVILDGTLFEIYRCRERGTVVKTHEVTGHV